MRIKRREAWCCVVLILALGCGRRLNLADGCGILSYVQETPGAELEINGQTSAWGSIAQSFQVTSSASLSSVRMKLQKFGTFATSQFIIASVHADNAGSPSATTLSSGQVDVTEIGSSSASFVFFKLSSSVSLNANTTYWVKLTATYGQSSANVVKASAHEGAANTYADGLAKYEPSASPGTWSNGTIGALRDLEFILGC